MAPQELIGDKPRSRTIDFELDFRDGVNRIDDSQIVGMEYSPSGIALFESPVEIEGFDRNLGYLFVKRVLDVLGSSIAILLCSPVMVAAALMVKVGDSGPIFYVHRRVGQGGREFTCLKFRTMHVNADKQLGQLLSKNQHSDERTFKMQDDPRITWFGKLLRKTSLDELPQLFNVLRGEMSLVGPRPPVPSEVAKYSNRDLQRLAVKPGITCIWQVSGRSRIPFPEQLEMDIQYIRERSLLLDMKLIARTIPAVLSADGAY